MKRLIALAAIVVSALAHATTLTPLSLLSPLGSTSGQVIASTGASSSPAWSNVSATSLASQAANTVVANVTGSTASPTAFAMPSCIGSNNALRWSPGAGFTCAASIALTTGNLSQFAATTSAQLAGIISDETGSGSAVFGTSPTIATPAINGGTINNASVGATTAGSGAFTTLSATSTVTVPTGTTFNQPNIVGVTNGSAAAAGSVGENLTANTTVTSLTTGTNTNCTSKSLSAGEYLVFGSVNFNVASTTTPTVFIVGIGTTSATFGANGTMSQVNATFTAGANAQRFNTPVVPLNISATTTVYLVAYSVFGTSTMTCDGIINAIRIR